MPYTFDDVVAAMQEIAPNDWRGFFMQRVKTHGPGVPLGGLENSGWKLVYSETPNESRATSEAAMHLTDVQFSLGFLVRDSGGETGDEVIDVIPGSPSALAGIAPGMKLVAVNGRKWNPDDLHAAIRQAKSPREPIELLIENEDFFRTCQVDYYGGEQYPHLERISGKPDLLAEIAKMKAPPVTAAKN